MKTAKVLNVFILFKKVGDDWVLITDVERDIVDEHTNDAVFQLSLQIQMHPCSSWMVAMFKDYQLKILQLGSEHHHHHHHPDPPTK